MRYRVTGIQTTEILDPSARLGVELCVEVDGRYEGTARVSWEDAPYGQQPSRASTGEPRADHVIGMRATSGVREGAFADVLVGFAWSSLQDLDVALRNVDGLPQDDRLDQVVAGVSLAAARAFAARDGMPLYRWLPALQRRCLPIPRLSLVKGGVEAKNRLDFEDFMVVPLGAASVREGLRAGMDVYERLARALHRIGFADPPAGDGRYSPALQAPEDVLDLLTEAIREGQYSTGETGMAVALDLGASQFREADGCYRVNGSIFDPIDFVEYLAYLVDRYPICSMERPMAEDDPRGWKLLTERLGERVQLVGNDHTVSSPAQGFQGIENRMTRAVRIEPNRLGTVTQIVETVRRSYQEGFGVVATDRSGETSDPFIADLAVALGCGQIAVGAPTYSTCIARLHRLEAIELESPHLLLGRSR